ncbi:MAG TPA: hypothetical protein VF832_14490 [Longimicrobiales bacterium]
MWPGPLIELSTIATGCGAVACAWVLFVVIALWRRGAGLPTLLPLGAILAIMLGVLVAAVLRLIGLRQGTDTALAAVAVQVGGALAGFAPIVATLLLRRRAAAR